MFEKKPQQVTLKSLINLASTAQVQALKKDRERSETVLTPIQELVLKVRRIKEPLPGEDILWIQ